MTIPIGQVTRERDLEPNFWWRSSPTTNYRSSSRESCVHHIAANTLVGLISSHSFGYSSTPTHLSIATYEPQITRYRNEAHTTRMLLQTTIARRNFAASDRYLMSD
jgi:hypothetical protein